MSATRLTHFARQASAFGIWLVDCFGCDVLTDMKAVVGKPLSFLLELVRNRKYRMEFHLADGFFEQHAWWHLGTGLGSYYLAISCQLLVLSLKEDPRDVQLGYAFSGLLPFVKRVRSPHYPNGDAIPGGNAFVGQKGLANGNRHSKSS